ncbi:MAG: Abi family protein, partial [Fusobacteriaceae bacterium]
WIAFESLALGEVIKFLTALKEKHKNEIMKQFNYKNYKIFHESLESLRIARNTCAHYNRFWNSKFYSPRKKIKGYKNLWNYVNTKNMVSYIYGVFSIMLPEDEFNSFNIRLLKIVENYKIDIKEMGFLKELILLDK